MQWDKLKLQARGIEAQGAAQVAATRAQGMSSALVALLVVSEIRVSVVVEAPLLLQLFKLVMVLVQQ